MELLGHINENGRRLAIYASAALAGEVLGGSVVGKAIEGTPPKSQPENPFFPNTPTESSCALAGVAAVVGLTYAARRVFGRLGPKRRSTSAAVEQTCLDDQTSSALPTVTKGVFAAVLQDLGGDSIEFADKIHERISEENPTIASYINTFLEQMEHSEMPPEMAASMISATVYRALESQAEADQLTEVFNL